MAEILFSGFQRNEKEFLCIPAYSQEGVTISNNCDLEGNPG